MDSTASTVSVSTGSSGKARCAASAPAANGQATAPPAQARGGFHRLCGRRRFVPRRFLRRKNFRRRREGYRFRFRRKLMDTRFLPRQQHIAMVALQQLLGDLAMAMLLPLVAADDTDDGSRAETDQAELQFVHATCSACAAPRRYPPRRCATRRFLHRHANQLLGHLPIAILLWLMKRNCVLADMRSTILQKRSVLLSSSGASTSSSRQNGAGLSWNIANTSAIAVSAFRRREQVDRRILLARRLCHDLDAGIEDLVAGHDQLCLAAAEQGREQLAEVAVHRVVGRLQQVARLAVDAADRAFEDFQRLGRSAACASR